MNRFKLLIFKFVFIFLSFWNVLPCHSSELFSASDIGVMYDEQNYEKLYEYRVDHITWGRQVPAFKPVVAARRDLYENFRKHGLKWLSLDIALIQEGGKYAVCDGKQNIECNKRYWDLVKGKDQDLKYDTELINRIKKRSALDRYGNIAVSPNLAARGIIQPMGCVNDPGYKKWLLDKDINCFSKYSMKGFAQYLKQNKSELLSKNGITGIDNFNFQNYLSLGNRSPDLDSLLWEEFKKFQILSTTKLLRELCDYAKQKSDCPILISANAPPHDWKRIPFFSFLDFSAPEIYHRAESLKVSGLPLFTYKMADALGKPIFATALGREWQIIKEGKHEVLVCSWIAQAYALGNFFNFPLKTWIPKSQYEPETKIYPALAKWIKSKKYLFDDYKTLYEHLFILSKDLLRVQKDRKKTVELVEQLIRKGVLFKIVPVDGIEETKLAQSQLKDRDSILTFLPKYYSSKTLKALENGAAAGRTVHNIDANTINRPEILDALSSIQVTGETGIYCLPRQKNEKNKNKIVIHLLNRDYLADKKTMKPKGPFTLIISKKRFPKISQKKAIFHQFFYNSQVNADHLNPEEELSIYESEHYYHIDIPGLNLWGIVEISD